MRVVAGSHLCAAPGAYKVQFRVTADNKTVLTADTTAAVADARFYSGRTAERAVAGRKYLGPVATIQDLNPSGKASDFAATIDWGDGTTSAGTVRKTAAGRFEVVGEHTFAAPARRTVTVTIKSDGGATATARSPVAVGAARLPRPRPGMAGRRAAAAHRFAQSCPSAGFFPPAPNFPLCLGRT